MQLSERRTAAASLRHVQVARARPRAAERAAAERERLEVGLHRPGVGRGLARERDHGVGGVERDDRTGEVREVQAGAAAEIRR